MSKLFQHLELVLTLVGLGLVFAVAAFAQRWGVDPWHSTAVTGVVVGVLHGGLFWALRQRRRRDREEVVGEIQRMLKDIINNQLAVITIASDMSQEQATRSGLALAAIHRSVSTISSSLQDLSPASLQRWRDHYREVDEAINNEGEPRSRA